jgi:hypothetical protein
MTGGTDHARRCHDVSRTHWLALAAAAAIAAALMSAAAGGGRAQPLAAGGAAVPAGGALMPAGQVAITGGSDPAGAASAGAVNPGDLALPGPFVTFLFSRTEMTAADGCMRDNAGIAPIGTVVAPYLRSRGMSATGTLQTGNTNPAGPLCLHYDESLGASWADAANLAKNYGWSFGSATATYLVGRLTPAKSYAETCGSAAAIGAHGLPGGHGIVAYHGAAKPPVALQTNYGAHCFAWGRRYGNEGTTPASAGTTPPYWQYTGAPNGGACNTRGAPCYHIPPRPARSIVTSCQAGLSLASRRSGRASGAPSSPTSWSPAPIRRTPRTRRGGTAGRPIRSCTGPNDNERYCYKDWKTIVKAVAAMPDITVTDPLTVGIAFGRPARYPDPVVNISRPADNSTVSGTVPVSGTARPQGGTSIARVQVRVDHRAAQPATGIRNWTASINTTLLTNGTHTITATATDSKGNVGTASVTIKVANPAVLSGPSAHPGVLAGGVTADLWSVAGP